MLVHVGSVRRAPPLGAGHKLVHILDALDLLLNQVRHVRPLLAVDLNLEAGLAGLLGEQVTDVFAVDLDAAGMHGELALVAFVLGDPEELPQRARVDAGVFGWALHCIRFAAACLAVREHADVISVKDGCDNRFGVLEDVFLGAVGPVHAVKLEHLLARAATSVGRAEDQRVIRAAVVARREGRHLRRAQLDLALIQRAHARVNADVAFEIRKLVVELLPLLDLGLVFHNYCLSLRLRARLCVVERASELDRGGLSKGCHLGLHLRFVIRLDG